MENYEFSVGWKKKQTVIYFGSEVTIVVKIQAYDVRDELSEEQKNNLSLYEKTIDTVIEECQVRLVRIYENASVRFHPRTFLFKIDGSVALLCDDTENPDEGIAIVVTQDYDIVSQDDYL